MKFENVVRGIIWFLGCGVFIVNAFLHYFIKQSQLDFIEGEVIAIAMMVLAHGWPRNRK